MLRSSRTGPTKIGSLSRASAVIVGALVALFGVVAGPLLGVFAATSASAATSGSGYTAITPYRALGTSAAGAPVVAGTPANVQITGTTVPAGATAAVLNVTASAPTSAGYLELYPQGAAPSSPTSNVNFVAGETVPNLVTVPLSAAGGVTVANFAGTTAVDVDVEGYYSAAGAGLYNPINPVRVAGTAASGTPIAANTAVPVTVTGGTIPTSATAVVVNLTAAGGSAASYLSAYAAGATPATTSSLNFTANETVANRDIVNVGTGGQIEVYNYTGSVNVDVDVDGYYAATGGAFVSLAAPVRVTDTRSGGFGPASGPLNGTSIASGGTETFNLATTASGIPSTASSVAANFTVVPGVAPGYITVFPTGVATAPTASDVNWPANSGPVANFTQADTAGTTAGSAQVYNLNSGSPVDLVIDDFGYFTSSTTSPTPPTSPAALYTTTVAANPASIPAGATSTVTATVEGAGGVPVNADVVKFQASGATCGTFAGGTVVNGTMTAYAVTDVGGLTPAVGVASIAYTAPTPLATAGTCTITATEANQATSGTAAIAQTTAGYATSLVASPASVVAGGSTNSTLTVTATNNGSASPSAVVTFGIPVANPTGTPGACGTLSATSTNANANGIATVIYVPSTTSGFCTITASSNGAASLPVTITQTSPTSTIGSNSINISPSLSSIPAGGTTTSSVLVTVSGSGGTGIAGDMVELSTPNPFICTLASPGSPQFLTTGTGGTTTAVLVTGTGPGSCVLNATESNSGTGTSGTITVTPTASALVVAASPLDVPGNHTSTSVITTTVTGPGGGPQPGDTITYGTPVTANGGTTQGACGTVIPPSGGAVTNGSGVTTATYLAGTDTPGVGGATTGTFCTISATVTAGPGLGTTTNVPVQIDQLSIS